MSLLACLLLLVLTGSNLSASEGPASKGLAHRSLLLTDLLPEAANRAEIVTTLTDRMNRPVSIVAPDPALLDYVRWATPDVSRKVCESAIKKIETSAIKKIEASAISKIEASANAGSYTETPSTPLETLLAKAESQLGDLQLDETLETLEKARSILPCSSSIVSRDTVRKLFMLEAVVHIYRKDDQHRPAVIDTLGVDSSLYLGQNYPPKVQKVFLEIAQKFMEELPLDVEREAGSISLASNARGRSVLFVDGQQAAGLEHIRPGRHVFQARGPSGAVRTALVRIAREDGPTIRLRSVTTFGLAAQPEVRATLATGILAMKLRGPELEALEQYLKKARLDHLLFLVSVGTDEALELRQYDRESGLKSLSFEDAAAMVEEIDVSASSAPAHQASIRLTTGGGWSAASSQSAVPEGTLALGFAYALNEHLSLSAFGKFRYEGSSEIEGYSSWSAGILASWRIPLGAGLALAPAIGYATGVGPAVSLTCNLASIQDHEVYQCGAEGEATVWTPISGHGPLARATLEWSPLGEESPWSFHLDLDGQLRLSSEVEDGIALIDGADSPSIPFRVMQADFSSYRVEMLAGANWRF